MSRKYWKIANCMALALAMAGLLLLTTRAAGEMQEWTTDTFPDFVQGDLTGVDIWSSPGTVRLDHRWFPDTQVNDVSSQSKLAPRLSFVLTNTGTTTETVFLAVWADERSEDHYPDIYFDRSSDGGRTWLSDTLVSGAHQNGLGKNTPDITVRATDESLWVVWHETSEIDGGDPGNIKYATSSDRGDSWSSVSSVYTGTARLPSIASHGASGYLYTIWEDERDDDGDIYISRYTSSWSTPIKISDAISGTQQREPHLAVSADGDVYAVWEDTRENDDGEVYFSRWLSGTTWSASNWMTNTRLSDSSVEWAGDPEIIAGPGGILYTTWYERISTGVGGGYTFQIAVARSNDDGENWTRCPVVARLPEPYEETGLSYYTNPAIGVDQSGQVYVTWLWTQDITAGTTSIFFSQSPDSGRHWTEPRMLTPFPNVQCADVPDLAASFDGEVVVAWEDYRETGGTNIYATGYPADNYLSSGTYARTLNPGGLASWGNITWTVTITPGTGLQIATRVMTAAGAGWMNWTTHITSGEAISHPSGRFIQYRAVFTSTASPGNDTSVLDKVVISYQPSHRIYLPLVLRGG